MAFSLPTFNITVNIFDFFNPPPGAPRLSSPAQLRCGRWVATGTDWGQKNQGLVVPRKLLLPAFTDIRSLDWYGASDIVEVPAGTGRWYACMSVDDVARNFHNQYRFAIIIPVRVGVPPIPGPPLP